MTQLVPIALFERGYTDLISVIPPSATLSPGSKIAANQLGKVPGRILGNGTWAGYNWRTHEASAEDVRRWALDGANLGLRAGRFPGLDIDSLDPAVVQTVIRLATEYLGEAPVRTGRSPKCLLMYRAEQPFTRMRMWLQAGNDAAASPSHLIELLGEGQQYLVFGTHPGTMRPYEWDRDIPPADNLLVVNAGAVDKLFLAIQQTFEGLGYVVRREGDGRKQERAKGGDQSALVAPSIEKLVEVVGLIPNTDQLFPSRDDYIKFGAAIRAACGDDVEGGFEVFSEWCSRWATATGKINEQETVRADWRRLYAPFSVGWPWLVELARGFGYNDAAEEFPVDVGATPPHAVPQRVRLSDLWLAMKVVAAIGDRLRYVPQLGQWHVWDGRRWVPDAMLLAEIEISEALHQLAVQELSSAHGKDAFAAAARDAKTIESTRKLFDVVKRVRADRAIAVGVDALDADPWLLNTPVGVVDLRTGAITPAQPEQLHTKITRVGPEEGGFIGEWRRFLLEATGNDEELIAYLQRYLGYCLTGCTNEQMLAFVYGPTATGKSRVLTTMSEIMHDYAKNATMDTFTASNWDRHSTDVARLAGARLVTASETQEGRKWDEQRIKLLSGGDKVTARFMRQDNFEFLPQFKLLFIGNHQPHVETLDDAIRRRIHIVPFRVRPAVPDGTLQDKLRAEYPAILAWMIAGCLAWQRGGLKPPKQVLETTQSYFEDEDSFARWIEDCCEVADPDTATEVGALYQSWREWCGENGEQAGSFKRLVQGLKARGFMHFKHNDTRRAMFRGLTVNKAAAMPWERKETVATT